MKRVLFFAMGLIFVLAPAGFAMHHGGGMKGGGKHHENKWWQRPAIAETIGLSAEEESGANDLWVQHRRKMIHLKGTLHAQKFELEVMDDKKDVDVPAFRAQFEKVQKVRADMDAERFNYRMAVRNLLGPERFFKIRSHFPMFGKDKRKAGKGMHGSKGMMGMGCGKGRMQGMHGRGAKSGCMMMGTPQGPSDKKNQSTQSDSQ